MGESIGKYRVVRLLGEGAMGAVYLAEDPDIGRQVAVKVMKAAAADDHERFRQEARIVGGLSHPNIVVLHDFGFHEGKPYLVMQYLPGASLQEWLAVPHTLPEQLRIMEGLVSALDHAHGQGVLHRDIKPSNVQVTPEGDGRLMDFGIARVPEAKLTATGTVMGTPAYIAPEILGDAQYSTRADNYSAALVLYEMLTGDNPFLGQTISSTLTNVLTLDPPDLADLRPELPRELCGAIMAHLARDPRQRPADLGPLLARIREGRAAAPGTLAGPRATQSIRDLRVGAEARRRARATAGAARTSSVASRLAWPLAAFAVVAGSALAWLAIRPAAPTTAVASLPVTSQPAATTAPPASMAAAPSPGASPGLPAAPAPAPERRPVRSQPPPTPTRAEPAAVGLAATLPIAGSAPPTVATSAPSPTPPPATFSTPPTTLAEPARPIPILTDLSQHSCRRGSVVSLELRGRGFTPAHSVRILRGGHEVAGLRITQQSLLGPERMRLTLLVGADVPLGSYSVILADPEGVRSEPVTLEVVL